jgi:tripartite-type tricarboxylate transporter receptor subunit TctC
MGKVCAIAVAFTLALIASGGAQPYPSRPITVVLPLPPGGAVDALTRIIGEHMREVLGQPIVVESVSGGGGTLGPEHVARAAPDGYTLGVGTNGQYVNNGAVYPLQYDLLKDFAPVALLPHVPFWLIGKKALPANNLQELIAWLKANGDKASAATVGIGTGSQLCGMFLQTKTGTHFQFVPYRGGAPALQDLAGGQIDIMCDLASNSLPQVKSGNIKAFAVASSERWFGSPTTPTFDEAGVPGIDVSVWHGLWAPRDTPKDIIAKLNGAVVSAYGDPTVRQRITDLGMELPPPDQRTPEALGAYQKAEIDKWWPIIKAAGIKSDAN